MEKSTASGRTSRRVVTVRHKNGTKTTKTTAAPFNDRALRQAGAPESVIRSARDNWVKRNDPLAASRLRAEANQRKRGIL